ncbi:MAG: hypothetical protein Q9159_005240 [Coniocarpon cinnabarinum]
MHTPYTPSQRQPTSGQTYIPPPPPPPQPVHPQNYPPTLPPPPPRPINSNPRTPGGANPNEAYTWTGGPWPRQMNPFPPPPPPKEGQVSSSSHAQTHTYAQGQAQNQQQGVATYNPGAYYQYQNQGHHPNSSAGGQPLTTATFVPGPLSWGIGVGIPGYEEYRASSNYDPVARDDSFNIDVPMPPENGPRSPIATKDELNHQAQNRPAPSSSITQNHHRPSLAAQWSLEHVLALLKANGFSTEWQDTFKQLDLHGSKFLDLGKSNAGRGPSLMYQAINPKLCEITKTRNIAFDQQQAREEGRRLRKLVRGINQNGGVPASSPYVRQRGSTIDQSSSTPSTAGDGESPGKQMPSIMSPRGNSQSQPRASKPSAFSASDTDAPNMERSRSAFTESALRGLDSAPRKQSPSGAAVEMSAHSPTSAEARANASSPQPNSAKTNSAGRYYNNTSNSIQRITSSEQSLNSAVTNMPGLGDAAKMSLSNGAAKAQDKRRPSNADVHGRNSSADGAHNGKEHRNIMSKIMNRRRKDEPATTFEEMILPSPSSPNAMKSIFHSSNASDSSLARPRSGHDRPSAWGRLHSRSDARRKFVLVTPDAYNYRLIDVSEVETADAFRSLMRYHLRAPADVTDIPVFITSPGQRDFTEPLTDAQLLQRLNGADAQATLKLFARTPVSPTPISGPQSGSHFLPSPSAQPASGRSMDEQLLRDLAPAPLAASKKDVDDKEKPYQVLRMTSGSTKEEREKELKKRMEEEREAELKKRGGNEHDPDLKKRQEEYRKDVERKQRDYHEKRRSRLTPTGRQEVIDFDKRRESLNDEKRDSLVPLRQPPPAPLDSHTLFKANSLRKSNNPSIRRSASERSDGSSSHKSWEFIDHADDRKHLQPSHSGIAGALASVGTMPAGFGAPKATSDRNKSCSRPSSSRNGASSNGGSAKHSPKGSPRSPGFTMSKGNVPFRIPDYDIQNRVSMSPDEAAAAMVSYKDENEMTDAIRQSIYSTSPHARSPNKRPISLYRQSTNASRKSYGPSLEFKEHEVLFDKRFTASSAESTGSDSDSDGGLFAVPLSSGNNTLTKTETDSDSQSSAVNPRRKRPSLSLRTNSQRRQQKTVSFIGEGRITDDDDTPRGENPPQQTSSDFPPDSAQVSAYTPESPDETSKEFRRRSFYSDVWADRPAVETVAERLDEFFPNVDLDQPMLDPGETTPPDSPVTLRKAAQQKSQEALRTTYLSSTDDSDDDADSDTNHKPPHRQPEKHHGSSHSVAQRQMRRASGISRTKSIRDVVKSVYIPSHEALPPMPAPKSHDPQPTSHPRPLPANKSHNERDNAPPLPNRLSTLRKNENMMRRRSTKMFGARIEQIKPQRGSRILQGLETIPQDVTMPAQDNISTVPPSTSNNTASSLKRQATFKWLKGQLIGKGTFGKVYLGFNTTTAELMAVKQVEVDARKAGSDKDKIKDMVKALDQEIDTMQNLEHENIVAYLGCEREEFKISIFLEYIDGGSIGSCLRKHGKFEEPVVSSLTRQTLQGLAYLHDSGILHRDLKADNILLTSDGICKISDFGISKKSDNIYGDDAQNTMQGSVFWMAPEVVRSQGAGYSAKVDIWSLGCVVLEMFAGRRPWAKDEAIGAIYKLGTLNQAPPIPDDVSKAIGPGAIGFMLDCFTIDPRDRPQAARLLEHEFCRGWQNFSFFDSELYQKIKPPT